MTLQPKQFYQFMKANNIIFYLLLLLIYALLVNFHSNIVDYFKIRFAQDAVILREVSVDGVQKISAEIPQSLKSNYVNFEFDFKLEGEVGSENLFQTASGSKGIRLELSPTSAGVTVADHSSQDKRVTFEINKKIIPKKWHHIKVESLQNEFIIVYLDRKIVVNTREYKPQFDIAEITFGRILSDEKYSYDKIKNVDLIVKNVGQLRWLDILLTIIAIFLILICLLIILNSPEECVNDSSIQYINGAYLRTLFFVYVVYLGSFFVTNVSAQKEIAYWPIIFIVLVPFKWKCVSLSYISLPFPSGIALSEVKRNIDCVKTPAMAALFIYIANKAVVSWLLPSDQPPLGYFVTEYFFGLSLFFIGFIRLAVDFKNFFSLFFLFLSPLVAINGLINLYNSPFEVSDLLGINSARLAPVFGPGVDVKAATSAGLTYALYFSGLLMAFIHISIEQKRWNKNYLFIFPVMFILLVSLYFTHARGAMIGLLISFIINVLLMNKYRMSQSISIKTMITAASPVVAFSLAILFRHTIAREESHRFEIWTKFCEYVGYKLILGHGDIGFGRFENNSNQVLDMAISDGEVVHHWHNIFLNSFFRGGIVGVASIIYFLVKSAKEGVRFAQMGGDLTPLSLLVIFLISGQVDFDLHIYPGAWMMTSNWMPLLMVAALNTHNKMRHRDFV